MGLEPSTTGPMRKGLIAKLSVFYVENTPTQVITNDQLLQVRLHRHAEGFTSIYVTSINHMMSRG